MNPGISSSVLLLLLFVCFPVYCQETKLNFHDTTSTDSKHQCNVGIPITYLPAYQKQVDEAGKESWELTEGRAILNIPTSDVAVVFVDTWNNMDPAEGEQPSEYISNLRHLLARCREHGITVIHAPNSPIDTKYPQYHQIQKLLEEFKR